MQGETPPVQVDFDLNIFYCFNIHMFKQKGQATSSSNISYGPSQDRLLVSFHPAKRVCTMYACS